MYLTDEGRRVLVLADQAVGDRLGDVLAEVDNPQAALVGLESWRQAIDAHRQRRRQQGQSARRSAANVSRLTPRQTRAVSRGGGWRPVQPR